MVAVVEAAVAEASNNSNPSAGDQLKFVRDTAIAVPVLHVKRKHSTDQAIVRVPEQDRESVLPERPWEAPPEEHERASKLLQSADRIAFPLSILWTSYTTARRSRGLRFKALDATVSRYI